MQNYPLEVDAVKNIKFKKKKRIPKAAITAACIIVTAVIVAVGFIIGVVQDSLEPAINSSGDVIFCATAEYRERMKKGEKIDF